MPTCPQASTTPSPENEVDGEWLLNTAIIAAQSLTKQRMIRRMARIANASRIAGVRKPLKALRWVELSVGVFALEPAAPRRPREVYFARKRWTIQRVTSTSNIRPNHYAWAKCPRCSEGSIMHWEICCIGRLIIPSLCPLYCGRLQSLVFPAASPRGTEY